MTTKEQVLQACTIEGLVVKLPNIHLDRKLYQDVAKSLQLIGGKWKGNKVQGFVFPEDPTQLLSQIANGEKRNLKKEYQFFATPSELADTLVQLACIKPHHRLLEPSAGQGAIINAINRLLPEVIVDCYELMPINQTFLSKIPTANFISDDFLKDNTSDVLYDRIIANPPFAKNQDIDHVYQMYARLAEGGRIVVITSQHWKMCSNAKENHFEFWLGEVNALIQEVPNGIFKESGTSIATYIITIDK